MTDKKPTKPEDIMGILSKYANPDSPCNIDDFREQMIRERVAELSYKPREDGFEPEIKGLAMKITYNKAADALYIVLTEKTEPNQQQSVNENFILDLDSSGRVIGIKILDAKKTYGDGIEPRAGWAESLQKMRENGDDVPQWDDETNDPKDDAYWIAQVEKGNKSGLIGPDRTKEFLKEKMKNEK